MKCAFWENSTLKLCDSDFTFDEFSTDNPLNLHSCYIHHDVYTKIAKCPMLSSGSSVLQTYLLVFFFFTLPFILTIWVSLRKAKASLYTFWLRPIEKKQQSGLMYHGPWLQYLGQPKGTVLYWLTMVQENSPKKCPHFWFRLDMCSWNILCYIILW